MAVKSSDQGGPRKISEHTAIKRAEGPSWDSCNDARNPQVVEATESEDEDEDESTEDSEDEDMDEDMDEDLGRRVKAVLEGFDNPYDSHLEPAPNLPAYHPSFARVECIYSEVVEDAINLLKLSPYKDSQTEALVEHMAARREIAYSKAKIIGVIGDSGVGKLILSPLSLKVLKPF
jgi:cobalamin biosynthesis protein CobT